jgi:hypothetical protein
MDSTDRAARIWRALPRLAAPAGVALALIVALIVMLNVTPRPAAQAGPALTVVYVGAEDCGPCRAWRRDMRPAFVDSDAFSRLRYREIIAERLRDLLTQPDWPADLAELRERVRLLPGAPQWFVLRGDRILASGAGLSAWQSEIWPAIRTQVRRDPRLAST